jgi:hypothetical protein
MDALSMLEQKIRQKIVQIEDETDMAYERPITDRVLNEILVLNLED